MLEKKKHIITETNKLFQTYGIKSVTMDDIAKNLSISKKTLYQYVSDKNDLVGNILKANIELYKNQINLIAKQNSNPVDELIELSDLLINEVKNFNRSVDFDLNKFYPEVYRKYKAVKHEILRETIIDNLVKGIKTGFYRKEINIELIGKVQAIRIENLFETELMNWDEIKSEQFFYELLDFYIHGIANLKGKEYFIKKNRINNNLRNT